LYVKELFENFIVKRAQKAKKNVCENEKNVCENENNVSYLKTGFDHQVLKL
jgi:hypothetical protein